MSLINKNQKNKKEDYYQQFHEFFKPMMPSIKKLKLASHIGSFFTQVFVIVLLMMSNLPIELKWLCALVSLVIGIFIGGIIEVGLSKFLPFTVRQLLGWEFHNNWFKAMFWAVLICIVAPLIFASPTLSGIGGNEIVDRMIKAKERPTTDHLDQKLSNLLAHIDTTGNADKAYIAATYAQQKKPIRDKFASLIQIQQNKLSKYQKVYKTKKGKWAIDHIRNAKNEIERLKAKMNEALSPIVKEETEKLNTISSQIAADKAYYRSKIEDDKTALIGDWEKAQAKRDYKAWIWGNILGALAVFFAFGTIICIIIIGIYKKGSGTAIKLEQEGAKSGNIFQNLMGDLGGKVGDFLPIGKAANTTEAARRQIGFEITNQAASGKAANPTKSGKLTNKFAAFTKILPPARKTKAANKSGKGNHNIAAKNRQLVINTKRQIAAKNSGKVTQKEVVKITGLSERTVRKYWKEI